MHQHDLPHISSKITNQLFERVDLPLTIGFLFRLVLRKFGLQCLKFMLCVQILEEESQKFLSNGNFGSPTWRVFPLINLQSCLPITAEYWILREAVSEGESIISWSQRPRFKMSNIKRLFSSVKYIHWSSKRWDTKILSPNNWSSRTRPMGKVRGFSPWPTSRALSAI